MWGWVTHHTSCCRRGEATLSYPRIFSVVEYGLAVERDVPHGRMLVSRAVGDEIGQSRQDGYNASAGLMHLCIWYSKGVWMDVPCKPLQAMPRTYGGGVEKGLKARGAGILSFAGAPCCPLCGSSNPLSPTPATESSPAAWIA